MKNHLLAISLLFLMSSITQNLHAQARCGSDLMQEKQLLKNPNYQKNLDIFEKKWASNQLESANTRNKVIVNGNDTIYEIPVVFHIIHLGSAIGTNYNPSMAKLEGVVDYLNQSYAATWPGYPDTSSGGVNIPIRFVMAKRDPSCNPSNGVTRHNVNDVLSSADATKYSNYGVNADNSNGLDETVVKGIVQWDPSLYYNIWVVNKIDSWDGYSAGGGVVGYAYFPGGTPALDGTIIMEAFNVAGENTLPHELGHAFSLYHTFQGGCNTGNCTSTGDRVCDTDPHAQASGCPTGTNPCTGTSWEPVVRNIMNYSNCPDRFTQGQSDRAVASLLSSRSGLVTSLGGTAIGEEATYTEPPLSAACTPSSIANPNNNWQEGPTTMSIGSWQYSTGTLAGDGYEFYVNHTANNCLKETIPPFELDVDQSYPVAIGTVGINPQDVRIWIDFNNDGTLDQTTELVFSSDGQSGDNNRIHTGNTIVIPNNAVTEQPLRVRVLADWYGISTHNSCGSSLEDGQIEDFSVILHNTAMPVTLTNIQAKSFEQEQNISINWETSLEYKVSYFEVERSIDGRNFTSIGTVYAKNNASKYDFIDSNPTMNTPNYYRLQIVDQDLSIKYSKVVSAQLNDKNHLEAQMYPNPVSDNLNIVLNQTGSIAITITNTLGQTVYQGENITFKQGVSKQIDLNTLSLQAGVYYIHFKNETGKSTIAKFVKL